MYRSIIACVLLAACQDTPGVECDNGSLCPDGTTCRSIAGVDRCLTDSQLETCTGKPDREACEVSAGVAGLCNQGACLRAGCGDGFASGTEQCDGSDLDGRRDCRDIGYYGEGVLGCSADCTFDATGCNNLGKCGDGIINNTEQCDNVDLGGNTCTTAGGYYVADGLACNDACRFDFTACTGFCGDGILDAGEECDRGTGGAPLFAAGFDNCQDLDYYRDVPITLCQNNCRVARSECDTSAGFCGDGVADVASGEECDDQDLGLTEASGDSTIDCRDLEALPSARYYQGSLACRPNCTRDTTACTGFCGDGERTGSETCDRLDLGAASCGAYGGNLGCNATCTGFTGACDGSYGDGELNGNERCDGTEFGGLSCSSFGYSVFGAGQLVCQMGAIDETMCALNGYCGDGIVQTGEQCDGADTASTDCTSAAGAGPLDCDENCQIATGTCQQTFWTRLNVPNPFGAPLELVDGYSANTSSLWVVSQTRDVWQWDGERWLERDLPDSVPYQPKAIGGLGEVIWIAMDTGSMTQLYQYVWIGPTTGVWMPDAVLPPVWDLYSDGTTAWAATEDGVWQHVSGATWSKVVDGWYFSIDGRNGIVMAAGLIVNGTNLARRDLDGSWARVALQPRNNVLSPLRTVSVISRDQAIVTLGGTPTPEGISPVLGGTALHWDGLEGWDLSTGPLPPDTYVTGAVGGEGDDVWILTGGDSMEGDRMTLFHHTGFSDFFLPAIAPTAIPIGAMDYRRAKIFASDPGNVWILGDGAVAHYEGPGWHAAPARTLREVGTTDVNGYNLESTTLQQHELTVAASAGPATWFAGCGINGCAQPLVIEHRDEGIAIANAPPRTMGIRQGVAGPIEAMAIDSAGWVWAASGLSISAIGNSRGLVGPAPPPVVLANPATAAYSLGNRVVFGTATSMFQPPRIYIHDATGWSNLVAACPTCSIPQLDQIEAIGASGPGDVWFAGGNLIAKWNGDVASPVWRIEDLGQLGPDGVAGISVASAHEAWVAKARNAEPSAIVQVVWDDTGPPLARSITRSDGGTIGRLRGVWGSSSRDVWFVGDAAEALHWDGARLAAYALPRGGARAITGTSAQDVWVVGAGGAIARFNQRLPSTTGGACPDAVPIYCSENPVTIHSSIGSSPVIYRLVSPISLGNSTGVVDVTVSPIGGGVVALEALEPRSQEASTTSTPSWCQPHVGGPTMDTTLNMEVRRGMWKYFAVTNRGTGTATYAFDLSCSLQPQQ